MRLLTALLAAFVLSAPVLAAQVPAGPLADIEAYLNGIDTLEARFVQIAPDGSLSEGEAYLDRPGRMRLDYAPPSRILLIATDWRVVFYDGATKQVSTIPVDQTPLAVLLAEEVDLERDVRVTRFDEAGGEWHLSVEDPDEPGQGSLELVFQKRPLELRRWAVTDAQGYTTHVLLEDIEAGNKLDPELFRWRDPRVFGYPDD